MKQRFVLDERTGKLVPLHGSLTERKADVWKKGKKSVAMAVDPRDVKGWERLYAENGVHVKHTTDGRPIVNSREQQNRMLAIRGEFNMDAGYGDRAPGDTRWRT